MKRIFLFLTLSTMVLSCANSQKTNSAMAEKSQQIDYPEGVVPVDEIDAPLTIFLKRSLQADAFGVWKPFSNAWKA